MSVTIEFFWDIVSPYTYMASTQIDAVAARSGAQLQWRPFLLGGVFKATGNRSPVELPAKAQYMWKNLTLWSRYYGIPLTLPSAFPISTLVPMRAAYWADTQGQGRAFAHELYSRFWGRGEDVRHPDVLAAAARAVGLDGQTLLAACDDPAVKDGLKRNTEEAVARGAFGAPWMMVGDVAFLGNDHLPLLEAYLAGRIPA